MENQIGLSVLILLILLVTHIIAKASKSNHSKCYDMMEKQGNVTMECCGGAVGGGNVTNYLSESCIDCPYFVLNKGEDDNGNNVI